MRRYAAFSNGLRWICLDGPLPWNRACSSAAVSHDCSSASRHVRKNENTGSDVSLILNANGDVSLRLIVPARKPVDVGQDGCSDSDPDTISEGNPQPVRRF